MKGVAAFVKDQGDGSVSLVFNYIEATSSSVEADMETCCAIYFQ